MYFSAAILLVAGLAASNAGLISPLATTIYSGVPTTKIIQGPSSSATVLGPDGSRISSSTGTAGAIVEENHPGLLAHAVAPAYVPTFRYAASPYIYASPVENVVYNSHAIAHTGYSAPYIGTPVVAARVSPVVAHASPVVAHAGPVVAHASPVVAHAGPVVAHAGPVVAQASPVVATRAAYAVPVAEHAVYSAPVFAHASGPSAVSSKDDTIISGPSGTISSSKSYAAAQQEPTIYARNAGYYF